MNDIVILDIKWLILSLSKFISLKKKFAHIFLEQIFYKAENLVLEKDDFLLYKNLESLVKNFKNYLQGLIKKIKGEKNEKYLFEEIWSEKVLVNNSNVNTITWNELESFFESISKKLKIEGTISYFEEMFIYNKKEILQNLHVINDTSTVSLFLSENFKTNPSNLKKFLFNFGILLPISKPNQFSHLSTSYLFIILLPTNKPISSYTKLKKKNVVHTQKKYIYNLNIFFNFSFDHLFYFLLFKIRSFFNTYEIVDQYYFKRGMILNFESNENKINFKVIIPFFFFLIFNIFIFFYFFFF